jgi:uncharacterized damage-inducible protein DinB
MTLADARKLLSYNKWANDRTLAAVDALSPEQRERELGSSFTSILLTAAHIAGAEWVWLERWQGAGPTAMPDWTANPDWPSVKLQFQDLETRRASLVAGLSDDDLARPLAFTMFNGTSDSQPLHVQLQHVVNHGTYHRGQIAGMLRQVGARATSTDFIRWAREA